MRLKPEIHQSETEIQRADPAMRRLALIVVIATGALGLVLIVWLQSTLDAISALYRTDPTEATRTMRAVTRLLGAGIAVVCFATAIWLAWQSFGIRRAERFPLPGARVVRDTPILTGAAARRQSRIALVFSLALLVGGVVVPILLTRLTSLLAPGAG
jgi:hypothetical protein